MKYPFKADRRLNLRLLGLFSITLGLVTPPLLAHNSEASQNLISCLSGLDRISQVPGTYNVQNFSRDERYLLPNHWDINHLSGFYLLSPNGSCLLDFPDSSSTDGSTHSSVTANSSIIFMGSDPWSSETIYYGAFSISSRTQITNYILQTQLPSICHFYRSEGDTCPKSSGETQCGSAQTRQALEAGISRIESLLAYIVPTLNRQLYSLAIQELNARGASSTVPLDPRATLVQSRTYQTALRLAEQTVESCRSLRSDILTHIDDRARAQSFNSALDQAIREINRAGVL
jgi:hypothetical protein